MVKAGEDEEFPGFSGIFKSDFQGSSLLDQGFFKQSTLEAAKNLLGTMLYRKINRNSYHIAPIVEVEAYTEDDPACHAYVGLTERTRPLFGPPGRSYVYFIYGMYHCFNVVTEEKGVAGAILVRALAAQGCDGPGKLCRQWEIDKSHNDIDLLSKNSPIKLLSGIEIPDAQVVKTKRIGISKAKDNLWRFIVKDHPYVSGKRSKSRKK